MCVCERERDRQRVYVCERERHMDQDMGCMIHGVGSIHGIFFGVLGLESSFFGVWFQVPTTKQKQFSVLGLWFMV